MVNSDKYVRENLQSTFTCEGLCFLFTFNVKQCFDDAITST